MLTPSTFAPESIFFLNKDKTTTIKTIEGIRKFSLPKMSRHMRVTPIPESAGRGDEKGDGWAGLKGFDIQ